jgi:hypothetical protein
MRPPATCSCPRSPASTPPSRRTGPSWFWSKINVHLGKTYQQNVTWKTINLWPLNYLTETSINLMQKILTYYNERS